MTSRLIRIGIWRNGSGHDYLPDPRALVDEAWDPEQRSDVADYLQRGFVAAAFMGHSQCRLCGQDVGSLELSDGSYVWPEGLAHYVEIHAVRLSGEVVTHIVRQLDDLEAAERDDAHWLSLTGLERVGRFPPS